MVQLKLTVCLLMCIALCCTPVTVHALPMLAPADKPSTSKALFKRFINTGAYVWGKGNDYTRHHKLSARGWNGLTIAQVVRMDEAWRQSLWTRPIRRAFAPVHAPCWKVNSCTAKDFLNNLHMAKVDNRDVSRTDTASDAEQGNQRRAPFFRFLPFGKVNDKRAPILGGADDLRYFLQAGERRDTSEGQQ